MQHALGRQSLAPPTQIRAVQLALTVEPQVSLDASCSAATGRPPRAANWPEPSSHSWRLLEGARRWWARQPEGQAVAAAPSGGATRWCVCRWPGERAPRSPLANCHLPAVCSQLHVCEQSVSMRRACNAHTVHLATALECGRPTMRLREMPLRRAIVFQRLTEVKNNQIRIDNWGKTHTRWRNN